MPDETGRIAIIERVKGECSIWLAFSQPGAHPRCDLASIRIPSRRTLSLYRRLTQLTVRRNNSLRFRRNASANHTYSAGYGQVIFLSHKRRPRAARCFAPRRLQGRQARQVIVGKSANSRRRRSILLARLLPELHRRDHGARPRLLNQPFLICDRQERKRIELRRTVESRSRNALEIGASVPGSAENQALYRPLRLAGSFHSFGRERRWWFLSRKMATQFNASLRPDDRLIRLVVRT